MSFLARRLPLLHQPNHVIFTKSAVDNRVNKKASSSSSTNCSFDTYIIGSSTLRDQALPSTVPVYATMYVKCL